jgi:phosphoribosylglycinamide formyltransferase-1
VRIAVLGSTRGTSFLPIVNAIEQEKLAADIAIVVSNKADAGILARAREHSLATQFVNPEGLSREVYDEQVTTLLREHRVELVVLVGYMRILSDRFIRDWQNRVINIHPSLLPAFAGKMDLDVHRAVLQDGVEETGCTVHIVTEEVDAGPVVVQKKCRVLDDDTPEILKARVQELEGEALVEAIKIFLKS